MIEFKIGDRVRCVDANPAKYRAMLPKYNYSDNMDGLQEGKVYIVRGIETAYVGGGFGSNKELVDLMGIKVEGITRPCDDMPFGASRFELYTGD